MKSSNAFHRIAFAARPAPKSFPKRWPKTFFTIPNRPGVKIPPRPVEGAAGHSRKADARCVRQSQHGDYLAAPGLVHRSRRGVLRLWRGYGTLRALAARGLLQRRRRVSLVIDAIETLNAADGEKAARRTHRHGCEDSSRPTRRWRRWTLRCRGRETGERPSRGGGLRGAKASAGSGPVRGFRRA